MEAIAKKILRKINKEIKHAEKNYFGNYQAGSVDTLKSLKAYIKEVFK